MNHLSQYFIYYEKWSYALLCRRRGMLKRIWKTPYAYSSVAKFPPIKHEFPGKLVSSNYDLIPSDWGQLMSSKTLLFTCCSAKATGSPKTSTRSKAEHLVSPTAALAFPASIRPGRRGRITYRTRDFSRNRWSDRSDSFKLPINNRPYHLRPDRRCTVVKSHRVNHASSINQGTKTRTLAAMLTMLSNSPGKIHLHAVGFL